MIMKKAFVGLVMLSMLATIAVAQKPAVVTDNERGWKRIGQVTASFKKQNESITVLGADEFSAIKLKVNEAPVNIERLQIFYESGEMEEIDVRKQLQAGAETSSLQLKHPDRDIQKVAFTYKSLPNSGGDKADVELYGLKKDHPKGEDAYRQDKVEEDAERAVEDTEREVEQAADEAEGEVEQAADETERETEQAADETDEEISETAAKVMADIVDKRHDTKVGPKGQVVFITDDNRYYYINNEGEKVFVTELQLKNKKDND
jgi:hypothetical protein